MNADDMFRFRTGWDEISKKMAFRRIKEIFQDYKDYSLGRLNGYSFLKVNKCIFDPENLEMYHELLDNFRSSSNGDECRFGEEFTNQLPGVCRVWLRRAKFCQWKLYQRPSTNRPEEEKRADRDDFFAIIQKLSCSNQFELASVLIADMCECKTEFKTVRENYGHTHPQQIELITKDKVPETEYLPNLYASLIQNIRPPELRLAILNCNWLPQDVKDGLKTCPDLSSR